MFVCVCVFCLFHFILSFPRKTPFTWPNSVWVRKISRSASLFLIDTAENVVIIIWRFVGLRDFTWMPWLARIIYSFSAGVWTWNEIETHSIHTQHTQHIMRLEFSGRSYITNFSFPFPLQSFVPTYWTLFVCPNSLLICKLFSCLLTDRPNEQSTQTIEVHCRLIRRTSIFNKQQQQQRTIQNIIVIIFRHAHKCIENVVINHWSCEHHIKVV